MKLQNRVNGSMGIYALVEAIAQAQPTMVLVEILPVWILQARTPGLDGNAKTKKCYFVNRGHSIWPID